MAHQADYQELLVRTGTEGGRHHGLTWVICDMHLSGVEVRPIKALDGELHTSEVFYDDVRILLTNVATRGMRTLTVKSACFICAATP